MATLREHIEKTITNNPDKICKVLEHLEKEHGDVAEWFLCHIETLDMYNKFSKWFENFDGTSVPHWSIEQLKNLHPIDYTQTAYTCYDFAYVANMKYSDEGDLMSTDNIFISAKRYLEDKDYYGDPSERAYHDGHKRNEYFKNELKK